MKLTATGLAWLFLAAYLIVTGLPEWVNEPREFPLLGVPVFGLVSLVAAFGLIAGRPFARGAVLLVAGLGLFGAVVSFATFSRFGLSAVRPFQFLLALSALFFVWSIVLVVWLWPARPKPRPVAS